MEDKLYKVFPLSSQVSRIQKQISSIRDFQQKAKSFEIKFSILKNQCLALKIHLLPQAYKATKIPESVYRQSFDFKFVLSNAYPESSPKLFFMSQAMIKFGFKPFRDYFYELSKQQGPTRMTLLESIQQTPSFLERCFFNQALLPKDLPVVFKQYFQLENIQSWKFVQMHLIKLYKRSSSKEAYICIDTTALEVIVLESGQLESSFLTCDMFKGSQIINIYKKKNVQKMFLIELKLSYPQLSGKYVIEFSSKESSNIICALIQCASRANVSPNPNKAISSESSSQEDDSAHEVPWSGITAGKETANEQFNMTIEDIRDQIALYQSLIDSSMTSENIKHYVFLLHKAVEYYSARDDKQHKLFLAKVHQILKNDMAQVLLESANEQKKGKKDNKKSTEIKSILDLI